MLHSLTGGLCTTSLIMHDWVFPMAWFLYEGSVHHVLYRQSYIWLSISSPICQVVYFWSRPYVTQRIYAYIACFVWRHIGHTIVWNYAFCIIFEWYFVLVFCLCFMHILKSVYWFHSKKPLAYVPVWCCACYFVKSDLTVNYLSHLVSALCSQALSIIPLAGIVYYKKGRYFDIDQTWQSYIWGIYNRLCKKNGLLRRKHFVAGIFIWYGTLQNRLHIYLII